MGDRPLTMPICFWPPLMTLQFTVMMPAISIAPQKEISPSPSIFLVSHSPHVHKRQKLTRKVQVSDAELGTLDVYWQVHFATAG